MTENKDLKNTFNDSFKKLKEISAKLQSQQQDPDIDALVAWVEEAAKHYKICKERIDKVDELIQQKLAPLTSTESSKASQGK